MRVPGGWTYVSEYCIRSGDYTVVKIGGANGWTYEIWKLKEQLAIGLPSAQAAIEAMLGGSSNAICNIQAA